MYFIIYFAVLIVFVCLFVCVEEWIPQPERKVWHPVVWQQPPPPIQSVGTGEVIIIIIINFNTFYPKYDLWFMMTQLTNMFVSLSQAAPHKRIIRNIYRFFKETENNPEIRKKYIEDMALALPGCSKSWMKNEFARKNWNIFMNIHYLYTRVYQFISNNVWCSIYLKIC